MHYNKFKYSILFFISSIVHFGCTKDYGRLPVTEIVLEDNYLNPKRIHGYKDRLFVSSGDIWNTSNFQVYVLIDDSFVLIHQSITPKTILDFFSESSRTFGIGVDGHLITYDFPRDTLFQEKLPYWGYSNYFLKSGDLNFISSGKAFRFGKISVFDEQFSALCEIDIPMEVSRTIQLSESLVTFAFGSFLVFDRSSCSWIVRPLEGYFLTDAISLDRQNEFIAIDIRGSMVGGSLQNSEISIHNQEDIGARKIIRQNADVALVGDDGLFMISRDKGESWERYKLEGAPDLIDLAKVDNSWLVLTSGGRVLKIQN